MPDQKQDLSNKILKKSAEFAICSLIGYGCKYYLGENIVAELTAYNIYDIAMNRINFSMPNLTTLKQFALKNALCLMYLKCYPSVTGKVCIRSDRIDRTFALLALPQASRFFGHVSKEFFKHP